MKYMYENASGLPQLQAKSSIKAKVSLFSKMTTAGNNKSCSF